MLTTKSGLVAAPPFHFARQYDGVGGTQNVNKMSLYTRIGDHAVLFRLRRRPFMLALSLQPIAPAGFSPDWIGAHAVLPSPDIFWGPKYRK